MLRIYRCSRFRSSTAVPLLRLLISRSGSWSRNQCTIAGGTKFYRRMENQFRLESGYFPIISSSESTVEIPETPIRNKITSIMHLMNIMTREKEDTGGEVEVVENRLFHNGYTQQSLPKYPERWTNENLRLYINKITYYDYTSQRTQRLITHIIKELVVFGNKTAHCQSLETYHMAIVYFLRNRDLRSAREVVDNMRCEPSLTTFKLLLLGVRQQYKNGFKRHPLDFMSDLLKEIRRRVICVDSETWNIVMMNMPDIGARREILKQMQKHDIPLTRRGLLTAVKDICEAVGPEKVVEHITRTNLALTIEPVNYLAQQLFQVDKSKGWKFLTLALSKWDLCPTISTYNMIIDTMVVKQRLDWMIGVVGAALRRNIKPTARTFRPLFEAALNRQYHPNKHEVLKLIWALWREAGHDSKATSFKEKAELQSRFNVMVGDCKEELVLEYDCRPTQSQRDTWNWLLEGLEWTNTPVLHHDRGSNTNKLASFILGFDASKLHPAYKYGFHKFYKTRYKQQWKQFKQEYHKAKRLQIHQDEENHRQSILNNGARTAFVKSLVQQGIIDDK